MIGKLSETQEIGLLKYLAELTSEEDLDDLLSLIVRKIPALLGVQRCSIYLTREFVSGYTGELINSELKQMSGKDVNEDFIVLAQTNNERKRSFIGKIFYCSGEDLTGWVFQTGKVLLCKNSRDTNELAKIQPGLTPSSKYLDLDTDGEAPLKPVPVLYVPLKAGSRTIGVLKLHRPNNNKEFNAIDERFATISAQVIAGIAQKIQIMSHQEKQIFELLELGTERNPDEVIRRVTVHVSESLDCPKVEYYERTDDGESMQLAYINGERIGEGKNVQYRIKEGFIGWVHRTGVPVYIKDLKDFVEKTYLDDSVLSEISDTTKINDKDRSFTPRNLEYIKSMSREVPFMAAPIVAPDESIQGVLCAHFLTRRHVRRQKPFDLVELQRLKTFASTISLALQFDLLHRQGQLLLRLTQIGELEELLNVVAQSIPKLIHGTDCFIYMKEKDGDYPLVRLRASNRELLDISYKIGDGKTGFAALAGNTLVIDHIGTGEINDKKINDRVEMLRLNYAQDVFGDLMDEENNRVGVIRLRNGLHNNLQIRYFFKVLCNKQIVRLNKGLPSFNMDKYTAMGSRPSFSFAAVPIGLGENELAGVITLARPSDETPFSVDDIEFVESIAKTLGDLINILSLQEHRKELFINLAHEVNTYLTPLLADAENIKTETVDGSDLGRMGDHLLGQVERLQIMTETILAIFSEQMPKSKMQFHSIYRPLMDAVVMFRDEAKIRGCDILDPVAVGGPGFPDIEMNLFELTLAFKNIIHNAIKYSYSPPQELDRSRFIKISGQWIDKEKRFYSINIQDYGVGISAEEINNRTIFRPFQRGMYSTDRNRTGSGVGLAFVEKIIHERHNGRVLVESIPQSGGAYLTTFSVVLPVRQPR